MTLQSMVQKRNSRLSIGFAVCAAAVLLWWGLSAHAHGITTLTQSYVTAERLSPGTIVSLKKNTSDHVTAAVPSNASSLFGVVVGDGTSLMSLSNSGTDRVQVTTSGVVDVYVSDINGGVAAGDQITISPIAGTGMKATDNAKVIGTAQAAAPANGLEQTYKNEFGREKKIRLVQVPVLVDVAYYYRQPEKTVIPQSLQNLANSVAGKQVNSLPILVSSGIFLVTLVVVASIIYAMIRSSIISVGRNPMSQSAVYRGILQLSALIIGVLAVAIVSIYLVLTKL